MPSILRPPLRPFNYRAPQRVVKIHNIAVGGVPGTNPMLLVGSLFYRGDKKVIDAKEGVFDKSATRREIEAVEQICGEYGVPFAIDLIATTPKSMESFLPYVSDVANCPIFVDGISPEARIRGYELVGELGIGDRAVANGIYMDSTEKELESIADSGMKAAVLLAFDPKNAYATLSPESRLKLLTDRLLPMAERAGITEVLVDSVILDPASVAIAAVAVWRFKDALGLPAGVGQANALGVVTRNVFGAEGAASIHTGVVAYLRMMGADFSMYGPLKWAEYIAPGISAVDSLLGYLAKHEGESVEGLHPMRRTLRKLSLLFQGRAAR